MKRSWPRLLSLGLLLYSALLFSACQTPAEEADAPTEAPIFTEAPAVVQFVMEATDDPAAVAPPVPTPSPTPAPTPVPFSYYAPTVNMSFEELVGGTSDFGEMNDPDVIWPKAYPPADTYKIIVDVYWQVTMIFSKDDAGEYTVPVRYMLCSTGDPRIEDGSETRRGTFNMLKPRIRFGHFLSGEAAQYWTLIRSRTYFHSILYDRQDKLSTYQKETYEALGSKDSHGCIRLTVPDARWIWYNIAYGTECEIREGDKNDLATKTIKDQLKLPLPPATQATITAGKTPYTDNWTIDTYLNAFDQSLLVPFVNEKQPVPKLEADTEPGIDPILEEGTAPNGSVPDDGGPTGDTWTPTDPGTAEEGGTDPTPDSGEGSGAPPGFVPAA